MKVKERRKCSLCKNREHTADDPADAVGLWQGIIYNFYSERMMPIKAWVCPMHASEMESGRYVKFDRDVPEED